jgi:hypothetical protein
MGQFSPLVVSPKLNVCPAPKKGQKMSLNEFLVDNGQQTEALLSAYNFELMLLQPLVPGRMRWMDFRRLVRVLVFSRSSLAVDMILTNSWQPRQGMTITETVEGGMISYSTDVCPSSLSLASNLQSTDITDVKRIDRRFLRGRICHCPPNLPTRRLLEISLLI